MWTFRCAGPWQSQNVTVDGQAFGPKCHMSHRRRMGSEKQVLVQYYKQFEGCNKRKSENVVYHFADTSKKAKKVHIK